MTARRTGEAKPGLEYMLRVVLHGGRAFSVPVLMNEGEAKSIFDVVYAPESRATISLEPLPAVPRPSEASPCVVDGCEIDHAGEYALCPEHLHTLVQLAQRPKEAGPQSDLYTFDEAASYWYQRGCTRGAADVYAEERQRSNDAQSADDRRGLYGKYRVERRDGSSGPGGKHERCEYFVLDLVHDKYAFPALLAYASACQAEYPELAADLRRRSVGERSDELARDAQCTDSAPLDIIRGRAIIEAALHWRERVRLGLTTATALEKLEQAIDETPKDQRTEPTDSASPDVTALLAQRDRFRHLLGDVWHLLGAREGLVTRIREAFDEEPIHVSPRPEPARLDADGTAKPKTEIVGVFPLQKVNFPHNAESLIYRDAKPEPCEHCGGDGAEPECPRCADSTDDHDCGVGGPCTK